MRTLLPKPRRDEALLLTAATTSRPRAVPADRLPCAPGTGAVVLAELRDADHHYRPQDLVPVTRLATVPLSAADADPWAVLVAELEESAPATDWADVLRGIEARAHRDLSRVAADAMTALLAEVA